MYLEYMPLEDEILPVEEQPLPVAASPTTDSPGYVPESDPEEEPEANDDEYPEEDPADYPADRDDDDEEEEEPSGDDADDEDEEEEEEHPAPADSVPPVHRMTARISIRDEPSISLPPREEVERLLALTTPPSSPLTPLSSPLPQKPSPPLPVPPPVPVLPPSPPASLIRPLGYRAGMIQLRAEAASTSHSPPLPPPIILSHTRPVAPSSGTPPLYEVGESSSAAVARPTGGCRADYGFVDTSEPKTRKTLNPEWFKQPLRPPTPDPEWNKRQVVLDQTMQPWFNQMVSASKDPLTYNDLMATPIGFSNIELEYNIQECFIALTDKLDWNNPEGDRYPFDLSKPLLLQGPLGHQTVAADYFFNNDLEYLKTSDIEISKFSKQNIYSTNAILGVKSVSVKKSHGHGHLEEIVVKRSDQQLYKFKECDFVDLHLNDIKDMLLFAVQQKLFHLDGNVIVNFIVALRMFTRSLILKRRVEDLQLGVKSYQKKLNITNPQKTFLEIKFKEPYTPSYDPLGIVYEDLDKHNRVLRADELYKFLDGTLKSVRDEIH
ncbi:hypothetical protein Tco_1225229, partial [Tanacetum coccineum]